METRPDDRQPGEHIVRTYDQELDNLSVVLLEMGRLVISQVDTAVAAVIDGDEALAQRVIEREQEVNAQDGRLEELVVKLLARRQPMGNDLRAALSFLKSGTDLERCGDEADKIARIARRIARGDIPPVGRLENVVRDMGDLASRLLTDTLNALHDGNMERALTVAEGDASLDDQYREALRIFHEHLDDDEETRQVVTELVLVVKALERVGDHATNIARYVIFAVLGKDVRHISGRALREELHERARDPGHR